MIKNNDSYCQKFDLKLTDKDRSLTLMYWLPKLHKTTIGSRFSIESKNCSRTHCLVQFPKFLRCFLKVLKIFIIKTKILGGGEFSSNY